MARGRTSGKDYGAFGLEFIGGIFFLVAVAFFATAGYSGMLASWNSGIASIWLPFIYPVAILAAIAVFLTSFANLGGMGGMASWASNKLAWAAAATLIVLTFGTYGMWFAILGFILSIIGSGMTATERR
ncbi:MAG: hypothetical protein M1528_00225 [Candidatus Marsarchaeota archaeon]|jgi:hypothetical protein|nr:hypothetical protein [Candidatus Marsarchaeota archaeon]MCL5114957.1 hypothetical protein [Candidatus Marsarchaeota archaeon]